MPLPVQGPLLKFLNRYFEGCDIGLGVSKELGEEITDVSGIVEIILEGPLFVLKKDGSLGVLENLIGQRIASRNPFGKLFVKIALRPFSFPIASFQVKAVTQYTIRPDAAIDRMLGYQLPLHLASRIIKEVEKRS